MPPRGEVLCADLALLRDAPVAICQRSITAESRLRQKKSKRKVAEESD